MTRIDASNRWDVRRLADQTGRVILVTGATSGIGRETARVLAARNGSVILAARDRAKGTEVAEHIRQKHFGADVSVRALDLGNLASVRAFATAVASDHDRLDVLINNAGVMFPPFSKTTDGFEIQMGTNHLGHFALTGLLMPLLQKTANSRIVVITSTGHALGNIDFDDLHWEKRPYNTRRAYGDSKLANLYFAYEMARRLTHAGDDHPRVTAAHPGWADTDLHRHSRLMRFLNSVIGQGVEMGVLPTLRAGFDDGAKAGQYFGPDGRLHWNGYPVAHSSNALSYDEEKAKRLWTLSEALTGVRFFSTPLEARASTAC